MSRPPCLRNKQQLTPFNNTLTVTPSHPSTHSRYCCLLIRIRSHRCCLSSAFNCLAIKHEEIKHNSPPTFNIASTCNQANDSYHNKVSGPCIPGKTVPNGRKGFPGTLPYPKSVAKHWWVSSTRTSEYVLSFRVIRVQQRQQKLGNYIRSRCGWWTRHGISIGAPRQRMVGHRNPLLLLLCVPLHHSIHL